MREFEQWDGFTGRLWKEGIDVRDFIQNNYTPYDGDEKFLEGPTEATDRLWGKLQELQKEERAKGGVLVELKWLSSPARLTATNQARSFMKFSLNITKHITRVYSTSTHQR